MARYPDKDTVYIPADDGIDRSVNSLDLPDSIISPELKGLIRTAEERNRGKLSVGLSCEEIKVTFWAAAKAIAADRQESS